jgi:hypothetical protein
MAGRNLDCRVRIHNFVTAFVHNYLWSLCCYELVIMRMITAETTKPSNPLVNKTDWRQLHPNGCSVNMEL